MKTITIEIQDNFHKVQIKLATSSFGLVTEKEAEECDVLVDYIHDFLDYQMKEGDTKFVKEIGKSPI